MTWAPGLPMLISDRLISKGGLIERPGVSCFNLYLPPTIIPGDAGKAGPWLKHLYKVYPDDADHIIQWFAHRVQRPWEKINHALVSGGVQGIGKDTICAPVRRAVGPWNFEEVSPQQALGRFNGFLKSVITRVSEARDLGDADRFAFYDHMKSYTAAPPEVLRVDGGDRHVAAYLAELDISAFDPKAPPPKTAAFWEIVTPEDAELADVLDKLGNPNAVTIAQIANEATGEFGEWIRDRKNRRAIPHRLEQCHYAPVRNAAATDGLWKINGARQAIYAKIELSVQERIKVASRL